MKILVVDDEEYRYIGVSQYFAAQHAWGPFNSEPVVEWASNYAEAKDALADGWFAEVWLDHDLGDLNASDGNDVARLVTPDNCGRAVVHSMNPVGAGRILATIKDNGVDGYRYPFTKALDFIREKK